MDLILFCLLCFAAWFFCFHSECAFPKRCTRRLCIHLQRWEDKEDNKEQKPRTGHGPKDQPELDKIDQVFSTYKTSMFFNGWSIIHHQDDTGQDHDQKKKTENHSESKCITGFKRMRMYLIGMDVQEKIPVDPSQSFSVFVAYPR